MKTNEEKFKIYNNFKDLYWPNVMLTRAFEAIKDEEIQLINYNQSAERIGKELLKRGLPG